MFFVYQRHAQVLIVLSADVNGKVQSLTGAAGLDRTPAVDEFESIKSEITFKNNL